MLTASTRWAGAAALALTLAIGGYLASDSTNPTSRTLVRDPITGELKCPAGYKRADKKEYGVDGCVSLKHPEPFLEVQLRQAEWLSARSAPHADVAQGAFAAAMAERDRLAKSGVKVGGVSGLWQPVGTGPLISNGPAYASVNGLGLVNLAGRIDSLFYDAARKRLFASKGTGGIWMSEDLGDTWRSIGDGLPSQIVGSVAFTEAGGGTLIAVSGDPTFAGNGYTGFGAFYSSDLGTTWHKAQGVPDGALGFKVEVDPVNPNNVYVASFYGLFRSADAGRTFTNVALPTGPCAGVEGGTTGRPECQFANVVTDVVVRAPGGVSDGVNANATAGTVLAAVGWRAGNRTNSDGTVQSPNNGIYRSTTGAPGSFAKLAALGFTVQDRIGRVELGATKGPLQDHDYVYAIVQDAVALNGGTELADVPGVPDPRDAVTGGGTHLHGIYVSANFGETWALMADDNVIAKNPATGSALVVTASALGSEPGIQAWYNMWVAPDPTRQTPNGIPTRLAFGLEEIWQNEVPGPMNGPATFKVIGRYFSDNACIFLTLGLPECPTNRPPTTSTTTHPDQHTAVWIPDGVGGVTLAVGNDGGFYKNHVAAGVELDNGGWGLGSQTGFRSLLPYDVAMAKDGTVWAGLQDNGHMLIKRTGEQFMTFGGDGTFAEVDPDNSDVAYEATPGGSAGVDMRVTIDGGKTWRDMAPPVTNARFVNPFQMDPTDARHLVTGGRQIVETIHGSETGLEGKDWVQVFNLGTHSKPGDATATATTTDPNNGMSAIAAHGDAVYAAFCGPCHIVNQRAPFKNGIATNVGGAEPPARGSAAGWHVASAKGLPNRFITSIQIDPANPRTVYVTLGGYSVKWAPPGTAQDQNQNVGSGHLYKSTDAGETFVDISGNLPDVHTSWVVLRGANQLIVGSDVGVFANDVKGGTTFVPLTGLPNVPISTMQLKPDNPNLLVVATYGRGVWTYRFDKALPGTRGSGEITPVEFPAAPLGLTLAGPYTFELSDEGWIVQSTGSVAFEGTWQRSAPGASSAFSFKVAPYLDERTTALISPPVAQNGGWIFVDFDNRRDTEPGFDFMTVEWSVDGATWSSAPWIWNRATGNWSDALAFDAKNVGHPGFALEKAAFKAPAGPLRIRFRFSSDQLISAPLYEGVYVDNVVIKR